METLIAAFYHNGRFDVQRASVSRDADGSFVFCDGHGDPWACKSYADAKARMIAYMADKRIVSDARIYE